MKTMKKEIDNAREQAAAQLESIRGMVADLDTDSDALHDEAVEEIMNDALSVEVRSAWYIAGNKGADTRPAEFTILLCTGGPACRIIGDLKEGEADTARLEYQDWGTPWTEYRVSGDDEEILLTYARCFYFGEGE